jgi:hypothetical protein
LSGVLAAEALAAGAVGKFGLRITVAAACVLLLFGGGGGVLWGCEAVCPRSLESTGPTLAAVMLWKGCPGLGGCPTNMCCKKGYGIGSAAPCLTKIAVPLLWTVTSVNPQSSRATCCSFMARSTSAFCRRVRLSTRTDWAALLLSRTLAYAAAALSAELNCTRYCCLPRALFCCLSTCRMVPASHCRNCSTLAGVGSQGSGAVLFERSWRTEKSPCFCSLSLLQWLVQVCVAVCCTWWSKLACTSWLCCWVCWQCCCKTWCFWSSCRHCLRSVSSCCCMGAMSSASIPFFHCS